MNRVRDYRALEREYIRNHLDDGLKPSCHRTGFA